MKRSTKIGIARRGASRAKPAPPAASRQRAPGPGRTRRPSTGRRQRPACTGSTRTPHHAFGLDMGPSGHSLCMIRSTKPECAVPKLVDHRWPAALWLLALGRLRQLPHYNGALNRDLGLAEGTGSCRGRSHENPRGSQGWHESVLLSRQPWRGPECRRLCATLVDDLCRYVR